MPGRSERWGFRGATRLCRGAPNVWGFGGHFGAPMMKGGNGSLARRHQRLRLPRLADALLSARAARAGVAPVLCGQLRHRGAQQSLLPPAACGHVPGLGRRRPAGVRLRGQGEPVPHPRQAAERARPAAHALPAPRARPRAGTRPRAHPAALDVPPAARPARRPAARAVSPPARALGARGAPCLMARRRGRRAAGTRQRRPVPA